MKATLPLVVLKENHISLLQDPKHTIPEKQLRTLEVTDQIKQFRADKYMYSTESIFFL